MSFLRGRSAATIDDDDADFFGESTKRFKDNLGSSLGILPSSLKKDDPEPDDEVDPLDAFMNEMSASEKAKSKNPVPVKQKVS